MAPNALDPDAEWLEADGQGGFAMGTAGGLRTRRYHALLLSALTPPTGRMVLVAGVEAWVDGVALSTQMYAGDVRYPDNREVLEGFEPLPWPRWRFRLPDGRLIEHDLFVDRASCTTVLRWRGRGGLVVRPLLAARDYHGLRREAEGFRFNATMLGGNVCWRPGVPIAALTNGAYAHDPAWYRQFLYAEERARGLDCLEDLAAPGRFTFDLDRGEAVMLLRQGDGLLVDAAAHAAVLAAERSRRAGAAPTPLARAAESYVVTRGAGRTVIAGFPWFTDWGRDTFIALRGLLIGTGQLDRAAEVLVAWAGTISGGMVPNRFPDQGSEPEFNSVDAALWFCVAVHDLLQAGWDGVGAGALREGVEAVIAGTVAGTWYGIGVDDDGLVRAGAPGQQLTWMDAKAGDWVVTPRRGKPVEVQALWINSLRIAAGWTQRWAALERQATASFIALFPDPATGGLVDVIGPDGVADRLVRPNQIFAIGGLPYPILEGVAAQGVLDLVERQLLTPMGLRTLAPDQPGYCGRYAGGPLERDGAYHQGTAWPWLMGPFVEAALRVRGPVARGDLIARCLVPLRRHLGVAGLGHVSEVADGDAPHAPGGCPFQAWSLGELIRIEAMLDPRENPKT